MADMQGRRNWVAIEIEYDGNPKILGVGPLGAYAHLRAILYCARHGTDGFIPTAAVWRILHDDPDTDEQSSSIEASMVESGLWHPSSNGYQVHDYLQHQANAESIREKRVKAGRKGGLASAKQRASKPPSKASKSKLDVDVDVDVDKNKPPTPPEYLHVDEEADREIRDALANILRPMPDDEMPL